MIRASLLALAFAALAHAQTAITPGGAWNDGAEFRITQNGRYVHFAPTFTASLPIATAGFYDVRFLFEEPNAITPGARSINVAFDEVPVLQGLDPFARFGLQQLGTRHAVLYLEAGPHRVTFASQLAGKNAVSSGVAATLITLSAGNNALEFRTCTGSGPVAPPLPSWSCDGLLAVQITRSDGSQLGPYLIIPIDWADPRWSVTAAAVTIPPDTVIPGVTAPPFVFDSVQAMACEPHQTPVIAVNGIARDFTRSNCGMFTLGALAAGDQITLQWSDPFVTAATALTAFRGADWR